MGDLTKQETDIIKQSEDVKEKIHFLAQQIISSVQQSEKHLLGQLEATTQENLKLLAKRKEKANKTLVEMKCGQPVDIRSGIFQPAQMLNVAFVGDNTLPIKCQHIGDIVAKKFHPLKLPDQVIVGKKTTAMVNIFAEEGCSVHPSHVSISIVPPDTSKPIVNCDFREIQIGKYEFDFTPSTRGQYKMKVTLDNKDINGSPFPFPVIPSLESRDKPVSVISKLGFPEGVAVSSNGIIAVAQCNKHTISIWYSNEKGMNILSIIQQQLKSPRGVALTPDDHILVTDIHRLQKFSFDGHYVKSIGSDKAGPDPLQFNCPRGLAIHPVTGQVFIADSCNNRIQVLNADLSFETKGDNKLNDSYDVAFDNEGCIYIADYGNDCIKISPLIVAILHNLDHVDQGQDKCELRHQSL